MKGGGIMGVAQLIRCKKNKSRQVWITNNICDESLECQRIDCYYHINNSGDKNKNERRRDNGNQRG